MTDTVRGWRVQIEEHGNSVWCDTPKEVHDALEQVVDLKEMNIGDVAIVTAAELTVAERMALTDFEGF
jgi:hypothetical protein